MLYTATERSYQKPIFYTLLMVLAATVGAYLYFLNLTIVNVVAIEDGEKTIGMLNSRIGELEARYIVEKASISMELAHSLGFTDSTSVSYLALSPSQRLSLSQGQ